MGNKPPRCDEGFNQAGYDLSWMFFDESPVHKMSWHNIRSCRWALPIALLLGCSTQTPVPLAGNELPYFPACVASESGGFQERKFTRLSWFGFDNSEASEMIDADCIAVEP